ncbi:hypothetical protein SO802_033726 [Lithocarpus litseifolius]|uniref:AN1-type domain-containing protein n=1 Tax=Lithocarpus litseifolius TaxID=425828 RepID=A0AAW2BE25_9ROSI
MAQKIRKEETEFKVHEKIPLCINNYGFTSNLATNNMCQNCFNTSNSPATTTTNPIATTTKNSSSSTTTMTVTTMVSSSTNKLLKVHHRSSASSFRSATMEVSSKDVATAVASDWVRLEGFSFGFILEVKREVNRCFSCRRKVGLTGFQCRCSELFCAGHRTGSHAWNSILKGRDVLLKGARWRIGCGEAVSIWNDAWLPSLEHPRVLSDIVPGFEDGRVSDLINPITRTWDSNLVHGLLSPEEAALVLSIPLSHTPVEDKIIWPFTPSGKYFVNSGSKFLTKLNCVQVPTANQQRQSGIWNQIWGLNVPNKVKHFMWRVCKEAVPSKHNLVRRKILTEDKCEQCGVESETVIHAVWECAMLDEIWEAVPELGKAGLGVVVHDSQGSVIASLSEQAPLPFSTDIVEAMAAARALVFAKDLGITEFVLEGDSEVVITSLRSKEASFSSFGHLLESAKSIIGSDTCIKFSHVRRSGNKIAHNLARHARNVRGLSVWVEDVPQHLVDVLFAEPD